MDNQRSFPRDAQTNTRDECAPQSRITGPSGWSTGHRQPECAPPHLRTRWYGARQKNFARIRQFLLKIPGCFRRRRATRKSQQRRKRPTIDSSKHSAGCFWPEHWKISSSVCIAAVKSRAVFTSAADRKRSASPVESFYKRAISSRRLFEIRRGDPLLASHLSMLPGLISARDKARCAGGTATFTVVGRR